MADTTGGEVIARMLQAERVEKVFGIIDGTYFGFYSALHRLGIEIVTPRHETSAAHMAGAYARLSGRLGVCMASNGPGVANLLPGLAVEQAEGNRVLAVTSARRPGVMYPDRVGTYQCFDQQGTIARLAKWSCAVPAFDRLPEIVRRALRKSWEGRPGVVHVDVPESIMNSRIRADVDFLTAHEYRRVHATAPSAEALRRTAEILATSRLPLIHAGSGVIHAGAFEELARVAELLHAPVTTSWAARGALSEDSPLAIPMVHVKLCHRVRNDADAALIVGARVGETDGWGKPPYWRRAAEQPTVQVDIDGEAIGQHRPAALGVLADAKLFLAALAAELERRGAGDPAPRREALARYRDQMRRDRERWDRALAERQAPMNPAHVARACNEVFSPDTVQVADGGNAAVWAMFYSKVRVPNTLLSTFKFGMLGAGVAQALGAAVARPGQRVVCITGDGAMGFHPQEIETAIRNRLPVVFVVLCDKQWGMVKMNQQFMLRPWKTLIMKSLGPEETIKADLGEIAFDKLAEAMGAHGERVADPALLRGALERARDAGRCAVVHVDVDPVKHLWAPGLIHFKKMHEEPSGR
ncbi:MAG: thiamine pyrophosphate-binding protein [Betaproteobacteria bacterium]|nr:MAG: thiamine pyrophosphate-binding protein [Betaproteobacteria bacterium]